MAETTAARSKKTVQSDKHKFRLHPVLKKMLRQLLVFLVSLSIVSGSIYLAVQTVYSKFFKPVDPENDTKITIEVPRYYTKTT